MQSHAPHTGKMSDAVVLIKIVIFWCFFFSIYFNYAVHAP
jgi:hypothetical protein